MSDKLGQPVLAFYGGDDIFAAAGTADYTELSDGERSEIAYTLASMSDDVAARSYVGPDAPEDARGQVAELKRLLKKLDAATRLLESGSTAADVCLARMEANGVLHAAQEIASGLFAWELQQYDEARASAAWRREYGRTEKKARLT
jgi:hypothetical protein